MKRKLPVLIVLFALLSLSQPVNASVNSSGEGSARNPGFSSLARTVMDFPPLVSQLDGDVIYDGYFWGCHTERFSDSHLERIAADDFIVPIGHFWRVKEVLAPGFYSDLETSAQNFQINFYEDSNGKPGKMIQSRTLTNGAGDTSWVFLGTLTTPITLKPGHYWLSIQANNLSNPDSHWNWDTSFNVMHNQPAKFNKVIGGSISKPTGWQPLTDLCLPWAQEFLFEITGVDGLLRTFG